MADASEQDSFVTAKKTDTFKSRQSKDVDKTEFFTLNMFKMKWK